MHIVAKGRIRLDGDGFDYKGEGEIPRAILQVDSEGGGLVVDGFELVGAHNASHNGAGIRVNAASGVKILNCDIHGNDMGVMSNGREGDLHAGENLTLEKCRVHENGDFGEPGQNHNLYLGGTSATVDRCEVFGALTGHNLKSRVHFLIVRDCHIYGGDNRQLDLVDSWDTSRPNSNAVVIRSKIEMKPNAGGNHNVIHFGQEKGSRNGTLFLIACQIVTPFDSPALLLDSPTGLVLLQGCSVVGPSGGSKHRLASFEGGSSPAQISGMGNRFSARFDLSGLGFGNASAKTYYVDGAGKKQFVLLPE